MIIYEKRNLSIVTLKYWELSAFINKLDVDDLLFLFSVVLPISRIKNLTTPSFRGAQGRSRNIQFHLRRVDFLFLSYFLSLMLRYRWSYCPLDSYCHPKSWSSYLMRMLLMSSFLQVGKQLPQYFRLQLSLIYSCIYS